MLVQVGGGVGESREHHDLAVSGIDGVLALAGDLLPQFQQLVVACNADLLCRRIQRGKAVAVLDQVLFPAQQINVAQQHLDLATNQQGFKGRVIDVHVFDVQLFDFLAVRFDLCQGFFDVLKLAMHRQCK